MKRTFFLLLAIGIFPVFSSSLHATAFINSTTFPPSGGVINYDICCDSPGVTYLVTGDFFTLYDAGGTPMNLAGDIANPALFSITENLTDPGYPGETPPDDPSITNIRFTYIGTANLTDTNFGTFSLADPSNGYRFVAEDGEAQIAAGFEGGTSSDIAPALVTTTPEPSSLALLGTGVLAMAGFAQRRVAAVSKKRIF